MRECGAQGSEGVWNSWPSGGASCSLALQPLASRDKTGMSGWGVVSECVCVCVCVCVCAEGGWIERG